MMYNSGEKKPSIKAWAEEDRPREKLLEKGRSTLSDAELLAILIGSGNNQESAVALCRRILADVDNNLNSLAKLAVVDLMKFKGIGEAKAISIVAALELGRRRKDQEVEKKVKLLSSKDAFNFVKHKIEDLPYEEFRVLYLNKACQVIKDVFISRGGVSSTVVDNKIILKYALELLASNMILVHNHPSGNMKPSEADKSITREIKKAGDFFGISLIDHIIIGDNEFFSFSDEGLI